MKLKELFPCLSIPVKSALSQYRKGISFTFFEEIHKKIVNSFIPFMKTYKGYHLVAFDGDQYILPASDDIISKGYRGSKHNKEYESYYPKMYVVKAVDILSGVVLGFHESIKGDEIGGTLQILPNLPKKCIGIYDRFYFSKRLLNYYVESKKKFICRVKVKTTFLELVKFGKSKKTLKMFKYKGMNVALVKIKRKNGDDIVFATNLPLSFFNSDPAEIYDLYATRWEIETNNRELTVTMKMERWRSKFYNGIMQEIYGHMIIINLTKVVIFLEGGCEVNIKDKTIKKSNFKVVLSCIVSNLKQITAGKAKKFYSILRFWILRTIEKRERFKRKYERILKSSYSRYKTRGSIKRRPA